MRKTADPVRGIVIGTLAMLLLAVPRTYASWSDLRSGTYSSLWFIWPMIGFDLAAMALAAWRTWRRQKVGSTAVDAEAPEA